MLRKGTARDHQLARSLAFPRCLEELRAKRRLAPPSVPSSPLVPSPCAPPPASWGRCALLLHGKGLGVTLFYSPLQNGRSAREHLLRASGRAGQKARWSPRSRGLNER